MTPFRFAVAGLLMLWAPAASAQLGTLVHDGPPTPEQISLYLPVTGTVAATTGTVRYRPTSGSTWTVAHPLFRIRPAYTGLPVADAFATVITGLQPGVSYTVETTVGSNVQTLVATTRALPGPAGSPNKTVATGSTSTQIQAIFDGLNPGDVLQFAPGVYTINNLTLNRSGTVTQPIYIRGANRAGVVLVERSGHVLYLTNASDVVLEDLTLEGSGIDSGTNSESEGVRFFDGYVQQRVTIRRVTMRGIDKGIVSDQEMRQLIVYDCTLVGNNIWSACFLTDNDPTPGCGHNIAWNDDGIRIPGFGNVAFNNTLSGFGDSFAVDNNVECAGIHFYRNDVKWTDDDAFEGDYGFRNMTFYDNRIENSMTLASFDPINGGPAFVFRNIAINTGRSPYKFNSPNSGHFIYNNTVVRTNGYGPHAGWGWVQFNNGEQRAWGFRNNILVYRGTGHLMAIESDAVDPVDFTNNAWFPNEQVWWSATGGSFSTIAAARAGLPATTPVFSGATQRHQADVISEADPFAVDVVLGGDFLTKILIPYTPSLSPGTAPQGTGVAIPGITDGFSGPAPDMGAIISGVTPPQWGDRTGGGGPVDVVPPAATTNLTPR